MADQRRKRGESSGVDISSWGPAIISLVIVILIGAVLCRIGSIKMNSRVEQLNKKVDDKFYDVYGRRGSILSADDKMLAVSTSIYDLCIDSRVVDIERHYADIDSATNKVLKTDNNLTALATGLSKMFKDKSVSAYKRDIKRIISKKGGKTYRFAPRKVSYTELTTLRSLPIFNQSQYSSGLVPTRIETRAYPIGLKLSRIIGRLDKSTGAINPKGLYGLEHSFDTILIGKKGVRRKIRGAGAWIHEDIVDAEQGSDIVTTIDVLIQDAAETALEEQLLYNRAKWGAALVMDVSTGDIKAIASLERRGDAVRDASINYAIGNGGSVEPGSTFKLVSAMLALESGQIDTARVIDCGNGLWKVHNRYVRDSDWRKGGHREHTFTEVFTHSSNVGTAKFITEIFEGREVDYMNGVKALKFNESFDLKIKGVAEPIVKDPTDKNAWSKTALAWTSFGYDGVQVSPLHILSLYAAIANGGKMMEPRLVKSVRRGADVIETFEPKVRVESICSKETLPILQDLMLQVVESGTGKALKTDSYKIAGKTGTAMVANGSKGYTGGYNASFAGYMPADNPKYACIVLISKPQAHGIYGGAVAGPVFRKITDLLYLSDPDIREWNSFTSEDEVKKSPDIAVGRECDVEIICESLDLDFEEESSGDWIRLDRVDNIESPFILTEREVSKGVVPDLIGLSSKDAIFIAENSGFTVNISGTGRVIRQSVPKGEKLTKGTLYLTLR